MLSVVTKKLFDEQIADSSSRRPGATGADADGVPHVIPEMSETTANTFLPYTTSPLDYQTRQCCYPWILFREFVSKDRSGSIDREQFRGYGSQLNGCKHVCCLHPLILSCIMYSRQFPFYVFKTIPLLPQHRPFSWDLHEKVSSLLFSQLQT